jgi:hypothetical protein
MVADGTLVLHRCQWCALLVEVDQLVGAAARIDAAGSARSYFLS